MTSLTRRDGVPPQGLPRRTRWATGAAGSVSLLTGSVLAFAGNTTVAVVLVAVGSALLVVAFVGHRVEELTFGSTGVTMKLSRDVDAAAGPAAARKLEDSGIGEFANAYALVQEELAEHEEFRTARLYLQDLLVTKAEAAALRSRMKPDEVRAMFRDGAPVVRVLSLGLMQGDPSLADFDCLLSSVTEPRTANEQYQGLRLARRLWPRLTRAQQDLVLDAIRSDSGIASSTDRRIVADEIVRLPQA